MQTTKNQPISMQTTTKSKIIFALVAVLLVIIIAGIMLAPRLAQGPVAGKAVTYGPGTVSTTAGEWGLKNAAATAGAPWTASSAPQQRFDEVDLIGFVNFPQASRFSTIRLRLNYNPGILQPVSVTPLDTHFQSDLGTNTNMIENGQNYVLVVYYTWSGSPQNLRTFSISGQNDLFKVRFKVVAPVPADDLSTIYSNQQAVWLEPVPVMVLNDVSGTNFGVYSTASGNENVQMVQENPNPASLSLTVYPGCHDEDDDGYAASGDQQACLYQGIDCNDNAVAVHPGATEMCNGLDDNCDTTADNLPADVPAPFNTPPSGMMRLQGVCFGYQTCTGGTWVNSYVGDTNYHEASSNQDTCDFFDNDCDGTLNEDAVGTCTIGGVAQSSNIGQIASLIPGNIFIDYTTTTPGAAHLPTQLQNTWDQLLLNLMVSGPSICGVVGQDPCSAALTDTTHVWYCRNNKYYVQTSDDGSLRGLTGPIYEYTANGNLAVVQSAPGTCS